ncbi:MAG: LuxR C-terminal-related transcriptional regulator [Planctomycetota bacterium]
MSIDELPKPSATELICLANPRMLWESIINDTSGRVFVFDPHGLCLYANDEGERKYQAFVEETIVGHNLTEMCGEALGEECLLALQRVAATRRPLVIELVHRGVRSRSVLRPLAYGEQSFVLCVSRDIADLMPRDWGLDQGIEVIETKATDLGPLEHVTQREMQILGLIGEGLSSAQIADVLDRSVKTVEWHRHQIGQKLGAKTRIELANIALRAGLCRFERYPKTRGHTPIPPRTPAPTL